MGIKDLTERYLLLTSLQIFAYSTPPVALGYVGYKFLGVPEAGLGMALGMVIGLYVGDNVTNRIVTPYYMEWIYKKFKKEFKTGEIWHKIEEGGRLMLEEGLEEDEL